MIPFFWENILNMWIVFRKGRRACLIETAHWEFDRNYLEILFSFAEVLGLVVVLDPISLEEYPRYFVTHKKYEARAMSVKNDQEIGSLLGMAFAGDYSDFMNPRSTGNIFGIIEPSNSKRSTPKKLQSFMDGLSPELKITGPLRVELFAEVSKDDAQLKENIKRLVKLWSSIFSEGFYSYRVEIGSMIGRDLGVNLRAEHVHDDAFFFHEFSEYVNDLYNFGGVDERKVVFPENPDRRTIKYVRDLWIKSMKNAGLISSRSS